MADNGDDDKWLYGDIYSNLDPVSALVEDIKPAEPVGILEDEEARLIEFLENPGPEHSLETKRVETATEVDINVPEKVAEENNADRQISSEDSEEDSDDDIIVAAGDFTMSSMENNASPSTAGINLKGNNLLTLIHIPGKSSGNKHQGKLNVKDFESIGTINGVPAHEYHIETKEENPWSMPGADITDYFNYGFNENTWLAYCERQRKMRCNESLVGIPTQTMFNPQVSISATNNNMTPPLNSLNSSTKFQIPEENTIEVLTADKREYSKHFLFPDLSVPPPIIPTNFDVPPPMIPMIQNSIHSVPPPGFGPSRINVTYEPEYYPHTSDPCYDAFEPTQDMQWNQDLVKDKEYYESRVQKEPEENVNEQDCESCNRYRERDRESRNRYRESDREMVRERDSDKDKERSRHRESDGVESPETSYKEEREYKHKSHSRSHGKRSRKHKSRSKNGSRHRHKEKKKKSEKNKEDDNSE